MKNLLRVFLLIALAFLANKVLLTDFEFTPEQTTKHTAALTLAE
ncbi:hypothetical protein [Hanstruepera marina]|nr:hypothetical protein [Hanstruepera marina]